MSSLSAHCSRIKKRRQSPDCAPVAATLRPHYLRNTLPVIGRSSPIHPGAPATGGSSGGLPTGELSVTANGSQSTANLEGICRGCPPELACFRPHAVIIFFSSLLILFFPFPFLPFLIPYPTTPIITLNQRRLPSRGSFLDSLIHTFYYTTLLSLFSNTFNHNGWW